MDSYDGDEYDDPDITQDELDKLLTHERQVFDLDLVTQTKKLLTEAAPRAAMNLIEMANRATNENVRYNANKFLVEKVLDPDSDAGKGVLEDLIGDLVKGAEAIANGKNI